MGEIRRKTRINPEIRNDISEREVEPPAHFLYVNSINYQ